MKALIVDDSRMMRKLIHRSLLAAGLGAGDIVEASDGEEALELIRRPQSHIDLILADWNMPRMDGMAFTKTMKSTPGLSHIPIVMITSQSQQDMMAEALSLGIRDYVMKPFDDQVLAQKLRTIQGEIQSAQ